MIIFVLFANIRKVMDSVSERRELSKGGKGIKKRETKKKMGLTGD
jgi:hypothetical protein